LHSTTIFSVTAGGTTVSTRVASKLALFPILYIPQLSPLLPLAGLRYLQRLAFRAVRSANGSIYHLRLRLLLGSLRKPHSKDVLFIQEVMDYVRSHHTLFTHVLIYNIRWNLNNDRSSEIFLLILILMNPLELMKPTI
jgi:hypothetical protein